MYNLKMVLGVAVMWCLVIKFHKTVVSETNMDDIRASTTKSPPSHPLSLPLTHSVSLPPTHPLSLPPSHSPTQSPSLPLTHSVSLPPSHPLSLPPSLPPTHSSVMRSTIIPQVVTHTSKLMNKIKVK